MVIPLLLSSTLARSQQGGQWTHELWSTKLRRQIGFILLDEVRESSLVEVGIETSLDGKSDHRAVFAEMSIGRYESLRRRRKKVHIGWKPTLNEQSQPSEFHDLLDVGLSREHADLAALVVEAATATATQRASPDRKHTEEVQRLFDQRREEEDTEKLYLNSYGDHSGGSGGNATRPRGYRPLGSKRKWPETAETALAKTVGKSKNRLDQRQRRSCATGP